jgi:hypothetical protein
VSKLILAHRVSLPSSKLLRNALVKEGYPRLLVTRNPEKSILFRYGNSASAYVNSDLNPPEFIKLLADKDRFSKFCQKHGISSPVFTKLRKRLPESFPVLVRSTLTGTASKGIYPIKDLDELSEMNTNWHWVPYYNLSNEYRVHICDGKIIKVFCKKFNGTINKNGIVIRNNDNSAFSLVDFEGGLKSGKYSRLKDVVDNLVAELSSAYSDYSLFFALDIGWAKNKKGYIVLEGNSAPGLNENTALEYAKVLGPLLFGKGNENKRYS